jgi:ABC-type bacteriocin/lantibiotic exporter with double-glycine peptidase domain
MIVYAAAAGVAFLLGGCEGGRVQHLQAIGTRVFDQNDVVLQASSVDCGAACLVMVCRANNVLLTLEEATERLQCKDRGVSMLTLKSTIESYGLHTGGLLLSAKDLPRLRLPAILFVEQSHFVVLDSCGRANFFFLRDPAIGRIVLGVGSLERMWRGEVLEIAPRDSGHTSFE